MFETLGNTANCLSNRPTEKADKTKKMSLGEVMIQEDKEFFRPEPETAI